MSSFYCPKCGFTRSYLKLHADGGAVGDNSVLVADKPCPEDGATLLPLTDREEAVLLFPSRTRRLEKNMRRISMNIGAALDICKAGGRVTRRGWNGKDMWVAYSPGHEALQAAQFWAGANREYATRCGGSAKVLPCFTMKTADGAILMGWLASQSDLDANDWEEVTQWPVYATEAPVD